MSWFAHSLPDRSREDWEPLGAHLDATAKTAEGFVAALNERLAAWGRALGLLHDVGKASLPFLARLDGKAAAVDHSTAGARVAVHHYGREIGRLLAFALMGHHGGLPDIGTVEGRLRSGEIPAHDPAAEPPLPLLDPAPLRRAFGLGFQVRMLYSCLVDADSLETEAFYHPERRTQRGIAFDPAALEARLDRAIAELPVEDKNSRVNRLRATVLDRCRQAASLSPGLFSLSVPTGGGKTLSALAFALAHARLNRLRRVVVVIPYTSIIEQTAQVYRKALGPEVVLEHHSNSRPPPPEVGDDDRESLRMAEENWDAPVVVTTSVQFFESLFASRRGACRKLHNLAGAVIVLDEAQLLPAELLQPCLAAITELVASCGASVVLTTATQPTLKRSPWLECGLNNVHEIMGDAEEVTELHRALRRVEIVPAGPMDDDALAQAMAAQHQVLTVVDTRAHARALFERIKDMGGAVHLSALMCPAHRTEVLDRLRIALRQGLPCRVVSTQLVEAGVDISFPAVYRALAGLDSIIQAAGRCNREGESTLGRVVVFEAVEGAAATFPPPGSAAPP